MQLAIKDKKGFSIVGIDMRTTNQNGEAMKKIPAFWQKFYHSDIMKKIPSIIDPETVYAVYSDYDEQGYYSMLIGVEAAAEKPLSGDLVSINVPASRYAIMTAKGPIPYSIPTAWEFIWSHDFPHMRAFRADFEVYDHRSKTAHGAEVDLYVSIL
jgi:predicted transcriptional regulator YdeE